MLSPNTVQHTTPVGDLGDGGGGEQICQHLDVLLVCRASYRESFSTYQGSFNVPIPTSFSGTTLLTVGLAK